MFSNGDVFEARIDAAVAETKVAGLLSHKYDKSKFRSHAEHINGVTIHTLQDGTKCSSAFVCDHYHLEDPSKPLLRKLKSISYTT